MTEEKCCLCGEVNPVDGRTYNGDAICKECNDYMKGDE